MNQLNALRALTCVVISAQKKIPSAVQWLCSCFIVVIFIMPPIRALLTLSSNFIEEGYSQEFGQLNFDNFLGLVATVAAIIVFHIFVYSKRDSFKWIERDEISVSVRATLALSLAPYFVGMTILAREWPVICITVYLLLQAIFSYWAGARLVSSHSSS